MGPQVGVVESSSAPSVRLTTSSGSIQITAEARDDIEVGSGKHAEHRPSSQGDAIVVRPSDSVKLRCPTGSDVVVGTSAGSVRLVGTFGDVRVTTESGSMSVDDVRSADLRTTSGSVDLVRCDGTCRATTTSGSVRIDQAGDVDVSGGSGTIQVSAVTARARTVSGTIELNAAGDASVQTVSGSVSIALPDGLRPRIVARGTSKPRIEVDEGDDCELSVRSVSGSITIRSR